MESHTLSPRRQLYDKGLRAVLYFCGFLTCALLVLIIGYIFYRGVPFISWELLSTQSSYINDTIGILPNILNTLYIILLSMVIVLPLGVGAAIGLAVLLMMGYIRLTAISDEVVSLQNQLAELETENVALTAQHEQMFDPATVKEVAEAAGMSKPSSSQIYYIDLSEGDSAVVYQQEESNLLSRLLTSLNHGIYAVVEYFE